ncbi:MAG: Mandelate racemase [Betaproteobacteria bacterium]|nr:Mandelate racemase [Betaproteobacteria bacterium]
MSELSVRAIRATAVEVPMRFVLGTSAAAVRAAPLLLVDVDTEEGITGRTYLFCYIKAAAPAIVSLLGAVEDAVKGERIDPAATWERLAKRFRLIGVEGIVRMAMAAFDTACWDALAIAANQPLAEYLGGSLRPIPAYNSCGLGLMPAAALSDEAEQLLGGGFGAVKLRLGYPTLRDDLAALDAVRKRIPANIEIMVDFNQALSVEDALERGRALDATGITWIEEPIRHDDYRGCARLARELRTPIQIGENFSGPCSMIEALDAQACDYVMPDLERIGGVTGWRTAAAIAAARALPMSSHLFPEISAHLLAVTPTAHWLEYVDWANAVVEEPLQVVDGKVTPPARAGNGLIWSRQAVARYKMQ